MATTAQHNAARNDNDLLARLIAAAEKSGVANAQQQVEANRGRLVAADIGGTTLADVHAYAVASYEPTPRPGDDATKITDEQLDGAVAILLPVEP